MHTYKPIFTLLQSPFHSIYFISFYSVSRGIQTEEEEVGKQTEDSLIIHFILIQFQIQIQQQQRERSKSKQSSRIRIAVVHLISIFFI